MLERNVGKKIRVIIDPAYGFEGTLMAVTHEPSGIWLSEAEAIVLRSTIAQPIPQVASREERSELFLHLKLCSKNRSIYTLLRRQEGKVAFNEEYFC